MLKNLWWASNGDFSKIHWLQWDKLGAAKMNGALGFRYMHSFNMAMLFKQCWRPVKYLNVSQVLSHKYFHGGTFLNAKIRCRPSFV